MSNSTFVSNPQSSRATRPARSRPFRPFRLALLLLVIALLSFFQPDCFRFFVRHFIGFEAWRNGVDAQIGAIDGSIFEPVVLRGSVWSYESENGPVTRLEIKTATATFSWRNLLPRSSGQWFQRLTLETVTAKVRLPLSAEAVPQPAGFDLRLPRPRGHWLAAPERFEAADVDIIVENGVDYIRFLQTALTLSNVEAGSITAGQIVVKQPWLTRTFHNVTGATAIQDGTMQFAGLTLEPGVKVDDFSTSLDDFARGQVRFAVQLAAFGGQLRAEVQTLPDEPQFSLDVAVPFSQINVAKLAMFLGVSEAAGGTIKAGRFSFRGPPQDFAKAAAELRFEIANFQWETRQWDSLVLGAKLLDGRIQIPELALAQGHNRLNLSGDMALPMPGVAWWKSDFSCDIAATIDNLTELSALMLPEFKYAAGHATIDGSVRGKDQKFNGRINVTGSNLRWHDAPIEKLAASVRLNGNDYQITDVSLFNGADYINGSGVVNIVGDKQYWGEIRVSVADLAPYSAILQKPIVPEPLAGGALIDWSGEGSAKGHSGRFLARLRKLRSLGATASLLHPINADFEATYSNGGMAFSSFALSDDESSFTAHVGVVNKALSLQGIRLMHQQALWLEGDALLPLDVWNAWPNTSLATLLDDQTVSKIDLVAHDLGLHETAQLSGMNFPIEGIVSGNFTAEGPIGALKTSGHLTLRQANIPLGRNGSALTNVDGAATFDGQTMHVEKFTGQHSAGDFSASGEIDFTNLRDPSLKLAVAGAKRPVRLFATPGRTEDEAALARSTLGLRSWHGEDTFGGVVIDTAFALSLTGPLSGASVSGEAKIKASPSVGFRRWQLDDWLVGDLVCEMPPIFTLGGAPWNAWHFDVRCTAENVTVPNAMMTADVRLTGTGAAPALVGSVIFGSFNDSGPYESISLRRAKLDFRDGFPSEPVVTAEAAGIVSSEPFELYVMGAISHPMRVFSCDPPLTEKAIRAAINGETAARFFSGESRFSLLVPAELREGVELAEWPDIKAEPLLPAVPEEVEKTPAPANGAPR